MSFLGSIAKAVSSQAVGAGARALGRGVLSRAGNIVKGVKSAGPKIFKGMGGPKIFRGAKDLGRQTKALPRAFKESVDLVKRLSGAGRGGNTRAVRDIFRAAPTMVSNQFGRTLRGAKMGGRVKDIIRGVEGGSANIGNRAFRNVRANYLSAPDGGLFPFGISKGIRVIRNFGRGVSNAPGAVANTAITGAGDQALGRGIMALGGAALGTGTIAGGTALGNKMSAPKKDKRKKKKKKSN
jgi:hypothetical protein